MHALGGEYHPGHMPMKIQQWIARLEANGWYQVRQNSSHCRFHHAAKTGTVTVAGKPLVALPSGTLNVSVQVPPQQKKPIKINNLGV